MTWELRDTQRRPSPVPRDGTVPGAFELGVGPPREGSWPPVETALFSWGTPADEDDLPGALLTREQERELQWEGIPTAREWEGWSWLCRRGVEAVEDAPGLRGTLDDDEGDDDVSHKQRRHT